MCQRLLRVFLLVMMALVTAKVQQDPIDQIAIFGKATQGPIATMTTAAGAPIDDQQTTTLNQRLVFNEFFMESITHVVREKIPERIIHAKGAGAFGFFEVTNDITDICKAKFLNRVGKKTPIALRFSPLSREKGGIDTSRETRGYSVKFYTEEGNFDIVGLNLPTYPYKDPILFPGYTRALKRNPATNLYDSNMLWDFITLNPESLHTFLAVFGDRGIPDGYRHMPGYSVHTYEVMNMYGDRHFVRFHFKPDLGEKYLRSDIAKRLAVDEPDYATKDLYRAIGDGYLPSWTAYVQILNVDDVNNAEYDVFDVTNVLSIERYPPKKFGRLVLNKNPINYFAEIEQLAFSPSNLVPGILGAPDKLFEARRLAYRDGQYHRMGANFFNVPVNCPLQNKPYTYNRDGNPPVTDNMRDIPNYFPNSFHGPVPYTEIEGSDLIEIHEELANSIDQTQQLYTIEMTPGERRRLVDNIVESLRPVTKFIQDRAIQLFDTINPELSNRIAEGLQPNRSMYYDPDY